MEIVVSKKEFEKMLNGVQCSNISNGFISKTFFYKNREFVMTSSIGSRDSKTTKIFGFSVIDIERYKGTIVPLYYIEHSSEVQSGLRERGYKLQKTRLGSRTIVFVGEEITFIPGEENLQLELF